MKKTMRTKKVDLASLEAAQLLTSTHDLNTILDTIAREATSLLGAERCSLYVYDPFKEELWSKVAQELEIDEIRLNIGEGIAGHVAQSKEILNIKDAYDTPHFNPEIDQLTGYQTRTLLVSPLLNISKDLVGVIEVLNKKDGTFTTKDEELIHILSTISAIAIEQAQLYEWNKVLRQYNENIIKNISSALIVTDSDYKITLANKVAEEIFSAYTNKFKNHILTKEFSFFPNLKGFLDILHQKGTHKIGKVEVNYKNKIRYYNIQGSKLVSDQESDYGYILLFDDITEKVLLEMESKQRENLSLIGNMTSSIIHDLKNPLSVIKAYLQIINKNVNEDEKFIRYFSIIDSEIDRLVSMTGEVLHFVRGDYGINLETCNFKDFITEITPILEQIFHEKQANLEIQIKHQGDVSIDKDKIRRLIFNIASNANEALSEKGSFEVEAVKNEKYLDICFKDNGKGIPTEIIDTIFDPFVSRNKRHGIGLGMAIVKKIVDEHKGQIKIKSKENSGTEITVSLPLTD